jgi:ATP-dependent helicase/nuclease subunit A
VQGNDAVSILTIHSAKGLEADIVVMLDSNHSMAAADTMGILNHWPLSAMNTEDEKKHFSVYGKKSQRGRARDRLFMQEEQQAQQENLNLLYVAATRAKSILIISGVVSDSAAAETEEGMHPSSWYFRFKHIPDYCNAAVEQAQHHALPSQFSLTWFQPPLVPMSAVISSSSESELDTTAKIEEATQEQLEGIAFHTLMERLTLLAQSKSRWPISIPNAEKISAWLPCSLSMATLIRKQAELVLQAEHLRRFFDAREFEFARNELDVSHENGWYRLDRVVVYADEVWILDYKRQLLNSEKADYQLQLQQYRSALQKMYPQKTIRTALILTSAELIEFSS